MPNFNNGIVQAGDIPCKGDGKTLGLTDGTNKFGIKNFPTYYLTSGQQNIQVGNTSTNMSVISNAAVGVTTDSTKSGIVADTSSLILICYWIIKY